MHSADDFRIEDLGIGIHCPGCGNQMVGDGDGLVLAESPTGVMFECGRCALISQWRILDDPPRAERVLQITWGEHV
jgi:hypothetical protein